MIAIDGYFETKEICGSTFNFKAGTGLLNLGVGNGKTILSCKRIDHWLNHRLSNEQLHIEQALKCDCTRLSDKIEELHNCDLKNIFEKKFFMSISNHKMSGHNTISKSIVPSNVVLIVVPGILLAQWKQELFRCLDETRFHKYVTILKYKEQYLKFSEQSSNSDEEIKIILITNTLLKSLLRKNNFKIKSVDLVFIDEIHINLLVADYIFKSFPEVLSFNFMWGLSANPRHEFSHRIFMPLTITSILSLNLKMLNWMCNSKSKLTSILSNTMRSFENNFETVVYGQEMSLQLSTPEKHTIFYNKDQISVLLEEWNWDITDLNFVAKVTEYINDFILKKNENLLKNLKDKYLDWETTEKELLNHDYEIECKRVKEKQDILEERLRESCPICFDNKSFVLPCCNQTMCFSCLQSMQKDDKPECPYCRQDVMSFFRKENIDLNTLRTGSDNQKKQSLFQKLYELTTDLTAKNKNIKILIVYDLNSAILMHEKFLKMNSINSIIINSSECNRRKFENDNEINCAFMNSRLCNYGLNMSFVNVIIFLNEFKNKNDINQMVGRANRFPRKREDVLQLFFMKKI